MNDEVSWRDVHTKVGEARRLFRESGLDGGIISCEIIATREMLRTASQALLILEELLSDDSSDWATPAYIGECWAMLADGRHALDSDSRLIQSFRLRSLDYLALATERRSRSTGFFDIGISSGADVVFSALSCHRGRKTRLPDVASLQETQAARLGESWRNEESASTSMFLPAAVAPSSISEPTSLSQEYDTSSAAPESPGRPASSSGFTEQVWRDLDLVSLSLQCRNDGPKYAPLGSLTEIYRRLDRVHSHLQHQPIDTLGLPQSHNARSHTPELSRTIIHQPSNVRASVPESHRATSLTAALESTTVSAAFIDTAARFAQDLHALIASLDSKNSILDVATDPSHDEVDDFADLSTGAAKVEAYRHKGNVLSQCGAHADAADIFEIGARFADSVGLEVAVRAMMWRLASQAHECAWEAARQAGDTTRYVHHLVRDARCFEMMAAADFTTPHVYRVAGKWFRTSKVLLSSGLGAASQTAEERSRAIINWGALPCSPPPAPPAL